MLWNLSIFFLKLNLIAIIKEEKKQLKTKAKIRKKEIKATSKGNILPATSSPASKAVRFAEGVKGIIYLILAISLIVAIILGQTGAIITLDDMIENLILAQTGKVVLFIIAIALLIYGFKNLRVLK